MTRSSPLSLAYARVAATDLAAAHSFAVTILGLETVEIGDEEIAFRSDARARSLVFDGSGAGPVLGLAMDDETDLDRVAERLTQNGFPCAFGDEALVRRREAHRILVAHDSSGNRIELVTHPLVSGRRFFPTRDCGVVDFQGVGLRSVDIERDVFFWTVLLGAHVSDRVGDITYLSIDDMHHRIALYPSRRGGLLNVAFEVESLDEVMRNAHFVASHQVRIVQGPGRETASDQIFLHFAGPSETLFSFVAGMRRFDPSKQRPRQFARKAEALCAWGSECATVPELAAIPNKPA